MSRASGYPSSRLAGSKPQEITFSNSQTNLHGVELDSDQIQPEYGNTGSYGSEVGSGHDGSMVSYEASQVSFAKHVDYSQ